MEPRSRKCFGLTELEYSLGIDEPVPKASEVTNWAKYQVPIDAWPLYRDYIYPTCGRVRPPLSTAADFLIRNVERQLVTVAS